MHDFWSYFQRDFLAYCTRPVSVHLAMACVSCSFDSFLVFLLSLKQQQNLMKIMFSCIHFPVWPYPPKIMTKMYFILVNCMGWQVWKVETKTDMYRASQGLTSQQIGSKVRKPLPTFCALKRASKSNVRHFSHSQCVDSDGTHCMTTGASSQSLPCFSLNLYVMCSCLRRPSKRENQF